MAKIRFTPTTKPPMTYDPKYQESFMRNLQQTLQRVNYVDESETVINRAMMWIGM